jgi:hypothetical protein
MTVLSYVPLDQPSAQAPIDCPIIPSAIKETAQAMQTIATSQISSDPYTNSTSKLPPLPDQDPIIAFENALDAWVENNNDAHETKNNDDPNKTLDHAECTQKQKQEQAEKRKRIKQRNTICCCCRFLYRAWISSKAR